MDKSRYRNSGVASRNQPQPPLAQGNSKVHRQHRIPEVSPDSASGGGGAAEKDTFSFKFGWRSSKQLFGTPIKKLLAEEMRESESKRRSPGVIAKLMGLDALPFQQHSNKQNKGSSENHLQGTMPPEKARSRKVSHDGRSSRRSSKDQQEFKDVFEVSEIPKVESSRYSSQLSAELKNNEAEMSFIEQKFMDAKRLATNQDLQSTRDFRDTLEVLDSNKDLLLKYFKQPDSLFKKHLNDLQAAPLQSHFGQVEAMNLSDSETSEHAFTWRSDRERKQLNYNRSHQRHHYGYPCDFDRRYVVHSSPKSSRLQFKGRHEQDAAPTQIVVLKPNLEKLQNGTRVVSSPCSSRTFLSERGNDTVFSDVKFRGTEMERTNQFARTPRSLRRSSLESREIAKEITRQMKHNWNNNDVLLSSSKFRGYAGDDSSCSDSDNESPEESEETQSTLGTSLDLNISSRRSSHSGESSVSREAKKRLSERWKMAHKSQEKQVISRSSTLAEMLAVTDKEMKATKCDSMSTREGSHDRFAGDDEPARLVEPLGISSRDGWKDGCIGSLSKSKSLPASSTAAGSPRTMLGKEAIKWERKRAAKSLDHRHGLNAKSTNSGHRKSLSLHSSKVERDEFSPDLYTNLNKTKINHVEDSPKLEVLATEFFAETLTDKIAVTDDAVDVASENADGSSEPSSDKILPEVSCAIMEGDTSAVDKDKSMQQELSTGSSGGSAVFFHPPAPALESSCSKDADQPSPVSVLEPSFTDDLSSCSECFESLSADLQGLRMQLQLLKLESEESVEGPMLVSSDEDGEEADTGISRVNRLSGTEDSWESSYIIDVLSESGMDGAQHRAISEVSPLVFDELEKRYCDWPSCSRSERRLLFDRINSEIVKIQEQSSNELPWVSSATTQHVGSKLIQNGLQDALYMMLLGNQGKVKDDTLGKVLGMQSEWLDIREDIDVIGREFEMLLLDELVAEIAGM